MNVPSELASCCGIPQPLPLTTLVIGYGNDLRSDDGAGIRVATRLAAQMARRPELDPSRVIVTRQLTPDLADRVAAAAQVVFVDAYVAQENDAGLRINRIFGDNAFGPSALGHYGEPEGLIGLAARLYGKKPDAWIVGVPAFNFEFGESISPHTSRKIDEAVALIGGHAVSEA